MGEGSHVRRPSDTTTQVIPPGVLRGARPLDVTVPRIGTPAGVALDASRTDGTLTPPVREVVPDALAVDLRDGKHGLAPTRTKRSATAWPGPRSRHNGMLESFPPLCKATT